MRGEARMNPHKIFMFGALLSNKKMTSEPRFSKEAIMTEKVRGNTEVCGLWSVELIIILKKYLVIQQNILPSHST